MQTITTDDALMFEPVPLTAVAHMHVLLQGLKFASPLFIVATSIVQLIIGE